MHSQSDFGYSTGSHACIACGKADDLYCCDGKGNPLPEAVKVLMQVKDRLCAHRRYRADSIVNHRQMLSAIEGDVEEWLIKAGFLKSEHDTN